jgi:ribosomal protein L22
MLFLQTGATEENLIVKNVTVDKGVVMENVLCHVHLDVHHVLTDERVMSR